MKRLFCSSAAVSLLTACAGITLGPAAPNALTYYDPKPYLFISMTKDCVSSATVISVPDAKRGLTLNSGYGSGDLTVSSVAA